MSIRVTQYLLEIIKHWISKTRVSQVGVEIKRHEGQKLVKISQMGVEINRHLGHKLIRISQFGIEVMRENVPASHYVDSAAKTPFAQ